MVLRRRGQRRHRVAEERHPLLHFLQKRINYLINFEKEKKGQKENRREKGEEER